MGWRAVVVALLIAVLSPGQSLAVSLPSFSSADSKAALAVCATEREPLLALQKQYSDLRRQRLTSQLLAGAKVGFTVLSVASPLGLAAGGASRFMGQQNGAQAGPTAADYANAWQAVSQAAAVGGVADAYMKVKEQQFDNDPKRMAAAVDADAATQLPISAQTRAEVLTLAACRDRQVAALRAQLAAAASDKDRKDLAHGQAGLKSAIKADIDLTDDVVGQQAVLTKTYTQGRAMAEGKSETDILGPQPAAYGEVSKVALKLPTPDAPAAGAPGPSYVTLRATVARSAPKVTADVVMTFPAGRMVTPTGTPGDDWWQIDIAGTPGFIRGADLGAPGQAPAPAPPPEPAPAAKGKGKAHGAPPPKPPAGPAAPSNIRALNREVLTAKTQGVDHLKTLAADPQLG